MSTSPTALVCWQHQASIRSAPLRISHQATCDTCGYELHVCRLCCHYRADETARCWEDRAEVTNHKEVANFCEYFNPASLAPGPGSEPGADEQPSKTDAAKAQLDALFKQLT